VAPGFRRGVNEIFALLEFNGIYLLITKLRCVTSQKNKDVIFTLQSFFFFFFCHYNISLPLGLGKFNDSLHRYAQFQRQETEEEEKS
jgi:hypothetical protein